MISPSLSERTVIAWQRRTRFSACRLSLSFEDQINPTGELRPSIAAAGGNPLLEQISPPVCRATEGSYYGRSIADNRRKLFFDSIAALVRNNPSRTR